MTLLATRTVQIERMAGAYVEGVWQEAVTESFDVPCSVQPASPSDMDMLPEGRRQMLAYRLYTRTPLLQALGARNADVAVIDGQRFDVVHTERWQNGLIPHHKSIVVLR